MENRDIDNERVAKCIRAGVSVRRHLCCVVQSVVADDRYRPVVVGGRRFTRLLATRLMRSVRVGHVEDINNSVSTAT